MKVIELLVPCYNEEAVLMRANVVQLTLQAKQKMAREKSLLSAKEDSFAELSLLHRL